jgi:hypothetical protein
MMTERVGCSNEILVSVLPPETAQTGVEFTLYT